jgi:DivIVA domain-containing protein
LPPRRTSSCWLRSWLRAPDALHGVLGAAPPQLAAVRPLFLGRRPRARTIKPDPSTGPSFEGPEFNVRGCDSASWNILGKSVPGDTPTGSQGVWFNLYGERTNTLLIEPDRRRCNAVTEGSDSGGSVARLRPEDIANRTFSSGGRRGYMREEVDSFLAEVARAFRDALESAARAESTPSFEQLGREAGAVLEAARQGGDSLRRRAEEEAEGVRKRARGEADQIRGRAESEASDILEKAAQEAERAMREAELVARRLRNVTKRQCAELLAEAQTRHERLSAHERELRRRIADIESVFESVRAEMDALETPAIRVDELALEPGREVEVEQAEEEEEETSEERSSIRLEVEQVQPKPVFDNRRR